MTTLSTLYRSIRTRLADAGMDSAALDARLLIENVTGHAMEDIVCRPMQPVSPELVTLLQDAVDRRIGGEPVHRIVGWREFYGLRLALSPETLEPRPDTETLVDLALQHLRDAAIGAPRILDLGTGTGAIGLALLAQLPSASAVLTDISADALATASRNAGANGLTDRTTFVLSDWYGAVDGSFDLIVSNPPYIPAADIAGLTPEVRLHDPLLALDGGADGLAAYRAIANGAQNHLARGGAICVEIGIGQGPDVSAIFAQSGLRRLASRADLAGIERAILFTP